MIWADFFPNGKSTKNMGKAIGIMLYVFGWGICNSSTMSCFFRDSLSKFPRSCRFKHFSVVAVEAYNLGGCKTDELVMSQSENDTTF